QTDAAGNQSDSSSISFVVDSQAPSTPQAELSNSYSNGALVGSVITGSAEAGSQVELRNANGDLLGRATADANGQYEISVQPALVNNEEFAVTAVDTAGNSSAAVSIVGDTDAPSVPTFAYDGENGLTGINDYQV